MNKIFTITAALLTLLATGDATAKNGIEASVTKGVNTGNTFPHLGPVVDGGDKGAIIKTTHRLIGKAYYKHNGSYLGIIDSTTYAYSNGRGGTIALDNPNDDENILFDNSFTYIYDNQIGGYGNRMQRTQEFTSDNKITKLTYSPWTWTSNGWVFKDSLRYLYAYNTTGNMIQSSSENWFGTLWTNSVTSDLVYNSNNNLVSMTAKNFYEVTFSYNNNDQIEQIINKVGTALQNSERKTYTYVGNNIATYEYEVWDDITKVWTKVSRWEYTYVPGTSNMDVELEYIWDNGAWTNSKRISYSYDSKDNVIQVMTYKWDVNAQQYVNAKRQKWEYNVDDLPTFMSIQTWNGTAWIYDSGDEEIHYYYERYFPTSVNNIAKAENSLNVYPVPANNVLNLNWDKHYDYNVSVYDMTGRVVMNTSTSNNTQLSVGNLPNGNYVVKVSDGAEHMMKQILVSH